MSNRLYDIINTFNSLVAKNEPKQTITESAKPTTKLEETMARVESEFQTFKEGKKAKPDFLDVDKDGNKKEPFKKAVKDKQVKEAAKPDYVDLDKDGNKKETMKKAAKDKAAKVNEAPELVSGQRLGIAGSLTPFYYNAIAKYLKVNGLDSVAQFSGEDVDALSSKLGVSMDAMADLVGFTDDEFNEAAENPYQQRILDSDPEALDEFLKTGYLDTTSDLYNQMYDYYANQMPEKIRRNMDKQYDFITAKIREITATNESAAPGQEDWIKKMKPKFVKQYGRKKGMEVLYATAWKRSKNEGAYDAEISEEDPVFEGDDYWDFKDLKDTPTSGTRKVAGTRYGGGAQKDDDDDEETTTKPAGEKRGRGRPKGSGKKMGYQGPTGRSKLMSKGAIKESRPSLMDRLLDETYANFGEDASDLTLDQDQLRQHIGDENFHQLRRALQVAGDYPEEMYDQLFDYFSSTGEMPYGTAKARTGDPQQWIFDKLDQIFGDEVGYDQENVDIDMGEPDEDYGTFGDDERPEEDEMNSESVNESKQMVAESMQQIVHSYPHEIKRFVNTGEMDNDLYSALYDYYYTSGEMPYGTAKARDSDPMEWVSQRFEQDVQGLQLGEDAPEFLRRPTPAAPTAPSAPDAGVDLGAELNELARLAGLKESIGECGEMSPFTQTGQPAQQSGMSINTNIDTRTGTKTMTVTADGEVADKLAEILSLSGLASQVSSRSSEVVAQEVPQEPEMEVVAVGEAKDEDREKFHASTTPDPKVAGVDAIVDQGDDLNRKKKQHADKPKLGDNPMAAEGFSLSKSLMRELESIKVKK